VTSSIDEPVRSQLGRRRLVAGYLVAVLGTVLVTVVLVRLDASSSLSLESLVYLALVVGCALVGGRGPAVLTAAASSLALNWWFTPPLHQLRISSAEDVVALVVFGVVALAVSAVVDDAARTARLARVARREADTLAMLNAAALLDDDVARLLTLVARTFGFTAASLDPPGAPRAGGFRFELPDGSALRVTGREPDQPERRVLAAFAGHLGLLRDRAELSRQADAARELEEGNRIRSALLAAISHDLRTPLAGAKVAVSTLRSEGISEDDRRELLDTVEGSVDRMSGIVANLLDMTRLEARGIEAGADDVDVEDLLARVRGAEPLHLDLPDDLPPVRVDPGLVERVLANLVENAHRHGAPPVEVVARSAGPEVRVAVVDHGPGVPEEERAAIFLPFRRLGRGGDGVGLGLAVARGLAETQGGRIEVEDTPGGGLTVVLVLPAARESR
jgi:two-component system sensor histidine kinase KdpD